MTDQRNPPGDGADDGRRLTRREAITGLGSAGIFAGGGLGIDSARDGPIPGGGETAPEERPIPPVPQHGWTAMNDAFRARFNDDDEESLLQESYQGTTMLRYVNSRWEQFGNPDRTAEVRGCWQHTFVLASIASARALYDHGGEVYFVPDLDEEMRNKFEVAARDNEEMLAVSAWRDDDTFAFVAGSSMAEYLQDTRYGRGRGVVEDPDEIQGLDHAASFRAVRTIDHNKDNPFSQVGQVLSGASTLNELAEKIGYNGRLKRVLETGDRTWPNRIEKAINLYDIYLERTDSVQPKPVSFDKGFVGAIGEDAQGPAAAQFLVFDAYVAPGTSGTIRVRTEHSSNAVDLGDEATPTWEVTIPALEAPDDTSNPDVPVETRFGAEIVPHDESDSETNVTDGPTAAFALPDPVVRGNPVPVETEVTFDGHDTVLGGAPVDAWEWQVIHQQSGDRLDTGNPTRTSPRLEIAFEDSGQYEATLSVTDTVGDGDEQSKTFRVLNSAPTGQISAPTDAHARIDDVVTFEGSVTDEETPDEDLEIAWYVATPRHPERDYRELGRGETTTATFGASGEKQIELRATDGAGWVTVDQMVLEVDSKLPSGTITAPSGGPVEVDETVSFAATVSDPETAEEDLDVQWRRYYDREHPGEKDYAVMSTARSFEHAFEFAGTEEIELAVSDGQPWVRADGLTLTVEPDGLAGTIEQPTESTVPVGTPVTFEGTASRADGSDGDLNYEWRADPAPPGGEVIGTGPSVSFAFESPGERTVTLAVSANGGSTWTPVDEVVLEAVTTEGTGPTARADADPNPSVVGTAVDFDATASTDGDGESLSFEWFLEGETAEGAVLEHTFEAPGTYPATVTVTDASGNTDSTTVDAVVEPAPSDPPTNEAPTARIEAPTSPNVGDTLTLDASTSADADGSIEAYEWTVDGTSYGGAVVEITPESPGTLPVQLTVTDDDGATDDASLAIEVNDPPTPRIDAPDRVTVGETVELDATASGDADGTIVSYDWSVDGTTHDGAVVEIAPESPGTLSVQLTVTDDDGATAQTSATIEVTEPENERPVARIDAPDRVTVGETVTLDGSGSSDSDGTITSYEWTLDQQVGEGEVLDVTFDAPGDVSVKLTVTDGDGATASATQVITVEPANRPPSVTISGPEEVQVGLSATFRADVDDPDGDVVSVRWGGARSGSGDLLRTRFESPGTRTLEVVATDGDGGTGTDTHEVDVRSRAGPPEPVIEGPDFGDVGDPMRYTVDVGGDPVRRVEWSGDVSGTGRTIATRFSRPGRKTVRVAVTGPNGGTETTTKDVQVLPDIGFPFGVPNVRVTEADDEDGPARVPVDAPVTFVDAAAGPDADVQWEFDDGRLGGDRVTKVFRTTGERTVRVRHVRSDGTATERLVDVEVTDRPDEPDGTGDGDTNAWTPRGVGAGDAGGDGR